MQDVRIDDDGNMRCWNCGGKNFRQKRTFRSKVLGGFILSLLTKKKLKCLHCGEYNDVGSAKPYDGPAEHKYRDSEPT